MTEPELKMEKFNEIMETVKAMRKNEVDKEILQDAHDIFTKTLKAYGISCHDATNCTAVGKLCFKCKNNYSRRSYFRDLLHKESDAIHMYAAADSSRFADIE